MSEAAGFVAPPSAEVPMVEPEVVLQIRALAARRWGSKAIARELGIARNTVRRYLRGGVAAEVQTRPGARVLDERARAEAVRLFDGPAQGNAAVVRRLLAQQGITASERSVRRAVASRRRQHVAADVASVRFETAPGKQLQIDFGQRQVRIGGEPVRVHLLVAVLGYSRRLFVKAFLSERQDQWLEGIAAAFRHFGGVPETVLGDNASALVLSRDRAAQTVTFHPSYLAFCRDWDVQPRACKPYRARTKGKTESGVKYVKRNALAGLSFGSFAELEAHLAHWMVEADQRVHGTTHERPIDRFERQERAALRPLPARPMPTSSRRLRRKVATDCLVDVDSVRYSVPHHLVREHVEVQLLEHEVRIFLGAELVASHRRSREPHAVVSDPRHYDGLFVSLPAPEVTNDTPGPLEAMGRSLADYAAALGGAA